jgi:hypothetical protein
MQAHRQPRSQHPALAAMRCPSDDAACCWGTAAQPLKRESARAPSEADDAAGGGRGRGAVSAACCSARRLLAASCCVFAYLCAAPAARTKPRHQSSTDAPAVRRLGPSLPPPLPLARPAELRASRRALYARHLRWRRRGSARRAAGVLKKVVGEPLPPSPPTPPDSALLSVLPLALGLTLHACITHLAASARPRRATPSLARRRRRCCALPPRRPPRVPAPTTTQHTPARTRARPAVATMIFVYKRGELLCLERCGARTPCPPRH